MFKNIFFVAVLFFAIMSNASAAKSNSSAKPKWEVGIALGGQYLADYRGSDEYNSNAIPVPFFVYRGDRIKLDRKGLRGDILKSRVWEFNVSGEVSLSGGDENNEARRGMPEIDPTFELGPSLNIALDGDVQDDGWLLRLPLRSVFAASTSGVDYVGYLFNPKITFVQDYGENAWRFSTSLGFTYGSENYHDYYYQVDPAFSMANRPAYDAQAGYSGSYFKTSMVKRSGEWRYGISLRYDNLGGTEFASDSPLVKTNDYFAVSFIVAKFLWHSE